MAYRCTDEFTLEKKLRSFLSLSLRAYNVPADEMARALAFVESLDIRRVADEVMHGLFRELAMHFDFSVQELMENTETKTE